MYSQQDVATLVGYKSAARISDYEYGKHIPSFETALQLSIALKTPIPLLFPNLYNALKRRVERRAEKVNSRPMRE